MKKKSVEMRALELAVKALWRDWKPQYYCEAEGCAAIVTPSKCGKNDRVCRKNIAAHFLSLAKKEIEKGGR